MTRYSAGDGGWEVNIRAGNWTRNGYVYTLWLSAIVPLKRRKKKWKADCIYKDPCNCKAIKQLEITPSIQGLKGEGAALMAHCCHIPGSLQHSLGGTKFSDTLKLLWLLCGRPWNNRAEILLHKWMTAREIACTALLEFYLFVTVTQPDAVDTWKNVKDGVYCWHCTSFGLENKKERK